MIKVSKEMMAALDEAIDIWGKRTKQVYKALCPLCRQATKEGGGLCMCCPINIVTDTGCAGTPYEEYQKYRKINMYGGCDIEKVFSAAQKEVDFLKRIKKNCEVDSEE